MARPELTPQLALLEEAMTVLFCRIDDTYYLLNPKGRHYESLKELSDSEIMTLALLQQLRTSRASALSCAKLPGSSPICSPEWWVFPFLLPSEGT